MKSIRTIAWTAEDPSAFDLAAELARTSDARWWTRAALMLVISIAWADAGRAADRRRPGRRRGDVSASPR